jgi:hypothetical protein
MGFVLSVRPPIRMSVCPHVTIRLPPDGFSLNLKFTDFSKSVENIQVRQKSDKINGYYTWGPIYIYNNILCIFKLGFMTATRCRGQVLIGLWRVRRLWKMGYWTAVWRLLRKQQEKILIGMLRVAQLIRKFVCHGNPQLATVYKSFQNYVKIHN